MKLIALVLVLLLAFVVPVPAQATPHSAKITWGASSDAAANPSLGYNVYRLAGACPTTAPTTVGTGGFAKVNSSPIAALTYTDTPLPIGPVCYYGTATLNGAESVPSNVMGGTVSPATITINISLQ